MISDKKVKTIDNNFGRSFHMFYVHTTNSLNNKQTESNFFPEFFGFDLDLGFLTFF